MTRQGWQGWDDYAPFYDWENAQTLGRKDVPFWRDVALKARGSVLELGCGTGRISLPLARAGVHLVGIDRSGPMLERAIRRAKALQRRQGQRRRPRLGLVRGDIRTLPFEDGAFDAVIAPYGIVQSLTSDRDLASALQSAARVVAPGGLFGVDLVPDVPNWKEYANQVKLRGPAAGGSHLTLIESVRQDRRRGLTIFEQSYLRRQGRTVTEHRFDLTFRTIPLPKMAARLEGAGFVIESMLGDYRGRPWDDRADVWIVLARRVARRRAGTPR